MRNNQPITQHERVYPAEQRLITTTNLKGIITYCNEACSGLLIPDTDLGENPRRERGV
ncbi:hypothetical protein DZ949_026650 [Pseudomonas aeruginosa]|nr:hypothetical protein [Pseudomonas aeruginosa]